MSRLSRQVATAEALNLLDEVGLDCVSTRQLAKRLGGEQPSLYWHFHKKEDLLTSMAEAALEPLAQAPVPQASDDWQRWFTENMRSFRCTLLLRLDGARLRAGSRPKEKDLDRIMRKLAFLQAKAGVSHQAAVMAMLAASRFTLERVLEEQADTSEDGQSIGGQLRRICRSRSFFRGRHSIDSGRVRGDGQQQLDTSGTASADS